jgi:DNA-binding NtrC family response regulator
VKKRVLFVDDDTNLLMGLQRGLRPMRETWDMQFVDSGEAALQMQSAEAFDVIVSDMRMGLRGSCLIEFRGKRRILKSFRNGDRQGSGAI